MANRTQLIFHLVPAVAQQVLAGNLRGIATLAASRSSVLPTFRPRGGGTAGLEAGTWYTVMAPAGVPKAVIDKINRENQCAFRAMRRFASG